VAEPFLGEIRLFPFVFAPKGWALCNGQLLPINQNQALFALLGTTYGGNGQTTFALPDFRGRVPIHRDAGHTMGQGGGEQAVTIGIPQLPAHTHVVRASSGTGQDPNPVGRVLASPLTQTYRPPSSPGPAHAGSVTNAGGSQAHLNMQPFLTLSFGIALQGIFPSPN
jgi:microcystin-dependent protein